MSRPSLLPWGARALVYSTCSSEGEIPRGLEAHCNQAIEIQEWERSNYVSIYIKPGCKAEEATILEPLERGSNSLDLHPIYMIYMRYSQALVCTKGIMWKIEL